MLNDSSQLEPFAAIVGGEHVRAATAGDGIDGVPAALVVAPGSAEQAAGVVRCAAERGLAIWPRGGGTKRSWGNAPARPGVVLDTHRMHALVEHAWGDMTATVQAGCTLAALQRSLAEHGQRLAVETLWPDRATLGGVLATNECGMLRVRFGGLRDQILGMTVVLPDGTVARTGGKVVKNVAGYDVQKLMTGALGTLGLIVEATLRLYPLPESARDVSFLYDDAEAAGRAILAVLDSPLAPTSVQLVAGSEGATRLDVRFEGLQAALDDQSRQLQALAAGRPCDAADAWQARAALWQGAEPAIVARYSVLPADLPRVCASAARIAAPLRMRWATAAHALGIGWLRLEGANDEVLLAALARLRADIQAMGGACSVLECPATVKARSEVWGQPGALELMRRVKMRFDPGALFNPGRFVGMI